MILELMWKLSVGALGGGIAFLFGGWSMGLQVLLMFMVVDWFTGILASYIQGKLSSKIGFKGIAKKTGMLCIIVVCHYLDLILNTGSAIEETATFFYIANELLSLIENTGRMGLPLPPQLTNAVEILKGKGETKNGK